MRPPALSWQRFWFEPSSPTDLAVSRVLFFAGLLGMYWFEDFGGWGDVSRAFWMPLPAFELLRLAPLGRSELEMLQVIWRLSLFTSAIGLQSTASMWIAFVLGFYLLGLPHNFGHTFHFDALLVIALGILACSRAGDALSVDAWMARRRTAPSGDYTWPVRAVWVAMSLVFFAAGLAKLRYGGLDWITTSNLTIVLTRAAYHVSDADPITGAGLWVAAHPWASRALAVLTVGVELSFATALVSRTARRVLVPAAFGMLVGIRVLMGPTFGGFLLVNVFWVPWAAAWDAIAWRAKSRGPQAAVPRAEDRPLGHGPVFATSTGQGINDTTGRHQGVGRS